VINCTQLHSTADTTSHVFRMLLYMLSYLGQGARGRAQYHVVLASFSHSCMRFVNTSVNVQYFFLCVINVVVLRIRGTRVRALISKKRIEHTFFVI
jgi:hypothetical protein